MPSSIIPYLGYADAAQAVDWLTDAFGLEVVQVVRADDGTVMHAELSFGSGIIMLGPDDGDTPETGGTRPGPGVYVVVEDVDAHFAHARSAGADVVYPPEDTDFGTRRYRARDLDGYEWSFGSYQPQSASSDYST